MLFIYLVLSLIYFNNIDSAFFLVAQYVLISLAVYLFAYFSHNNNKGKVYNAFRRLYIIPIVYFIYSQIHTYLPLVNPIDFDNILIAWDKFLFGVNPTEWIYKFSHPILTEYLQFTYMTFFFMPILVGIEFTYREKDEEFFKYARFILFGFYLSYLLYFFMPAIGPRFTIHDFHSINAELPGLWLYEFFREAVNLGGGVNPNSINPIDDVNRDCMPSGHTMMTFMNILLVFKFNSKFRWLILIIGLSLIISTVYLRYHYVVDVIAGILFAILAFKLEPKIEKYLNKIGFKRLG